jgi:uncharacterized protein (DUF983 family)
MVPSLPTSFPAALRRGWRGRCPRCGEGGLFGSYLKMRSACEACGQALEPYRADDAPAYFTILIVGHVVVPLVLVFERWAAEPPLWQHALLWLPLSIGLSLLLLPRIKGGVIAALWTTGAGAEAPATPRPNPAPPSRPS